MEQWYNAVAEYIAGHRQQIVEDLMELVRFPSISQSGKDGLPFGKEVDAVLEAAAALSEKLGFPAQVCHEGGYALAVCPGKGDGIGLFGHADVVPVNDDWIKTAPFAPIEQDGVLYGRGVSDNKAGVIASLYALAALKAAGVMPKSKVTVYIGGSEETGMQDIAHFVANCPMPAVSLVPDGGFPVSLGEKGIMRAHCVSKESLRDVKKLDGGKAYNVILDRVEVELADGQKQEVKGLTSHAASPEGSVNAACEAAKLLCAMDICDGDKRILSGMQTALDGYYGQQLGIESEGVFGKLTCANGITKVQEDGRLLFTLDIRYGSEAQPDWIVRNLTQSLDALGFACQITENDEGFLLDQDGKAMEIVLDSCRQVCGEPEAKPFKMMGGTYARHLKNAFAMSHSAPWDRSGLDLPAGHGGAHQSDECLSVDALLQGICCIALILGRLDRWLCPE